MTAPAGGGLNVLREIAENAAKEAERLDAEADRLEQQAHDARMRAVQLRAQARTQGRFG